MPRITKKQKKELALIVGSKVEVKVGEKPCLGEVIEDLGPYGEGKLFKVLTAKYGSLDLHINRLTLL